METLGTDLPSHTGLCCHRGLAAEPSLTNPRNCTGHSFLCFAVWDSDDCLNKFCLVFQFYSQPSSLSVRIPSGRMLEASVRLHCEWVLGASSPPPCFLFREVCPHNLAGVRWNCE